ncbi:hypothetical protein [Enterococcus raffinosus]|uniref:Uncharacterized protein n=1 Tax=Enterococcus raffinosus ATCC 49464 TaxID=1158602 RepID=R2QR45_9ENTE|nr:hypothetical protein [Enterococcus raffinosus]EOH74130.1 hypothetical protein UAK_03950 [Enterococcus raffinosus ATCC 49464]EOT82266.1 hypothetical protein I590_00691 [Enterococcus raffinosus ATCC 49464]UXK04486.1 hypothetical protein N7K38_01595 [Enterococcus raffinosus]HDU2614957.1 hypothetical protein [Enterococcus faecalis]
MTTKEEIKRMTDNLSDEQAEKVYSFIYTMLVNAIETVEPDEFDLQMIKEYEESSEEDKKYISAEELYKELGLKL